MDDERPLTLEEMLTPMPRKPPGQCSLPGCEAEGVRRSGGLLLREEHVRAVGPRERAEDARERYWARVRPIREQARRNRR
jgi:hypothetical protein